MSQDHEANGSPDIITTTEYGPQGLPSKIQRMRAGDDAPYQTTMITRDPEGHEILRADVEGGSERQTRTQPTSTGFEIESIELPSKTPIYKETVSFDAEAGVWLHTFDHDGDGVPDETLRKVLNHNGRLWRLEYDLDNDGKYEQITLHSYDAKGLLSARKLDWDTDGFPDQTETFVYDAKGNLTSQLIDTNADALPDIRIELDYGCWASN